MIAAKIADTTATLPRPLIDEVIEKFVETFKVPENLALPLYQAPAYLPSDSGSGRPTFAHPSLEAVIRVKLDRRGVPLRSVLYVETFDQKLDSAFAASLGAAFPDPATAQKRTEMTRDTLVVDFSLSTDPSFTKRERAENNRQIAIGRLLELPFARIALPHFPDAKAGRPIAAVTQATTQLLSYDDFRNAIVEVYAVLDTTGKFGAFWFAEASNQAVANLVLERLRGARYVPATIAGCPVPARISYRFLWGAMPSRSPSEYRPSQTPPPHE